jgi:hypothetical protein
MDRAERGVPPRRLHDSAWIIGGTTGTVARPTTAPEQYRLPAFSVRARAAEAAAAGAAPRPASPGHPLRPRRNQPRIPTPKEEEMLARTLAPGGMLVGSLPSTPILPATHKIARVPVPSLGPAAQRDPAQDGQQVGLAPGKTLQPSSSVPLFDVVREGLQRPALTQNPSTSSAPAAAPSQLVAQRPGITRSTTGLPPTASDAQRPSMARRTSAGGMPKASFQDDAPRPSMTQHASTSSAPAATARTDAQRPAMTQHASTSSAPAATGREDAPRPSMSHKISSGSAPAVITPADVERPRKRSIASRRASTAQNNQRKGESQPRPSTASSSRSFASFTSAAGSDSLSALGTRRPSDSRRIIDFEQFADRSAPPGTPTSPWMTLNRNPMATSFEAASGSPASLRSNHLLLLAEREPLSPRSGGLTPAPRQRRPGSSAAMREKAVGTPPRTPIRSPPTWVTQELGSAASPFSSPSKSPMPDAAEPVVVSTARRVAVTSNTPRLITAGLPGLRRGSTPQSSMSDVSVKAFGTDSEYSLGMGKSTRSDSVTSMASLPTTSSSHPHPTVKAESTAMESIQDTEPEETILASPPRSLEQHSPAGEAPAVGLTGLELGSIADPTEELADLYWRESWSLEGSPEGVFTQLAAYDGAMARGAAASALLSPTPFREPEPVSPLTSTSQMLKSGWSTETSADSVTSDDGSDAAADSTVLAVPKPPSKELDLSPFSLFSTTTAASTAATSPPTSSAADSTPISTVPNFARPWDALHIEKKSASLRSQASDTALSERTDRTTGLTVPGTPSAAQTLAMETRSNLLRLSRQSIAGDIGHDILAADEGDVQIEQLGECAQGSVRYRMLTPLLASERGAGALIDTHPVQAVHTQRLHSRTG